LEFMKWKFSKANVGALRSHLNKTGVGESIVESRMKNLSFSQRSCVIFAALTFVPPHLLIMDEPTNFLDLDSVDSLIKAVNKFKGGLVVVTHNRDFLKRTVATFLSIIPGAFLEFATMKDAERATYSFISALESGQHVDVKSAILNNRGGGAAHTEEEQAIRTARLTAQQSKAKAEAEAIEAEKLRVEAVAQEKEKARLTKLAALKDDWVTGDACWAPAKGGKWVPVVVVRNTSMGVTCKTESGEVMMMEAKRLRQENPESQPKVAPAAAGGNAGAGRGRGGGGASRGGAQSGARGGAKAAAGGPARGGRGGAAARGGRK